ncbi:major facilitator superfamily domain-containing protein [Mrakia frigida]|uniref:major facilitator superfamily domain-containing protein n=1 Tax=Mrakia frigida TaxID=29902 RepID=UPI003FCBFF14
MTSEYTTQSAGLALQGSPTPTVNGGDAEKASSPSIHGPAISNARKYTLLFIFSLAQFLDIFAASAVVLALGDIAATVGMTPTESIWIVNAYALVLAATLLTGGRLADIWSSKWVFIIGFFALGAFSLGLGFVKNKIGLLLLRALSAAGAALTIPAATNLVVHLFPDPKEQATALALFGGSGAIANIIGLILGGALLVADYTWIFFFITLISIPFAIICIFIIPKPKEAVFVVVPHSNGEPTIVRKARFDYGGTFFQIASITLLIYALTEANVKGWDSAGSIATLIIGVLLFPVFFWMESRAGEVDALIRPSLWKIPNFTLITLYSFSLAFWYFAGQVTYSVIFQEIWHQSAIMTAVRFLPSSISGVLAMGVGSAIPLTVLPLKARLVGGSLLAGGSMLMFAFAYDPSSYWKLIFVGFAVGSAGNSLAFISAYVNFLQSVPAEVSGVTGAVLQSVAQLGVAFLIAIQNTIQIAYPEDPSSPFSLPSAKGYKYGFIFAAAVCFAEAGLALAFFRTPPPPPVLDDAPMGRDESGDLPKEAL